MFSVLDFVSGFLRVFAQSQVFSQCFFCLLKQAQDKMKERFDLKAVQCEFGPAANCSVQPLMPNAVGHAWSKKKVGETE